MWIFSSTPRSNGSLNPISSKALSLLGARLPIVNEPRPEVEMKPTSTELESKRLVVELASRRLGIVSERLETIGKELVQHIWGGGIFGQKARKSLLAALHGIVTLADGHTSACDFIGALV